MMIVVKTLNREYILSGIGSLDPIIHSKPQHPNQPAVGHLRSVAPIRLGKPLEFVISNPLEGASPEGHWWTSVVTEISEVLLS